jgi:hypothetical protein
MTELGAPLLADAPFAPFPKIARLNRLVTATEKIDGTNAVVYIADDLTVRAGSRTRWITPKDDNFGFARWVAEHEEALRTLGPGWHFGEWWGSGVGRGYDLPKGEKRFSLFNTARWSDPATRPSCCFVVPVIAEGDDICAVRDVALAKLRAEGSQARLGFMRPEGICLWHSAAQMYFKVTLEKDSEWKGKQ